MLDKVYIELSDICGLKCSFCPQSQRTDSRGVMSLEDFRHICESLSTPKRLTNLVCLHILGDPLAVKNLDEYLKILDGFDLRADLVSNAKFLHTKHFALLSQKPIHQVAFSLSAFVDSKASFHKNHLERVLAFCKFCKEHKSEIFIQLRLHQKHLQGHLLKSKEKNPTTQEILEQISTAFDKDIKDILHLVESKESRARLAYKIFLVKTRDFEWGGRDSLIESVQDTKTINLYCYGVHKQLGILSNGVVVPCCIDAFGEIVLGNIKQDVLGDILQRPLAQEIAQNFKIGKAIMPKCQRCDYARGLQINT